MHTNPYQDFPQDKPVKGGPRGFESPRITSVYRTFFLKMSEWQAINYWRVGDIGSSLSNGLRQNLWYQKLFNCLCLFVNICVCIVKHDMHTICI